MKTRFCQIARLCALLIGAVLSLALLAACGGAGSAPSSAAPSSAAASSEALPPSQLPAPESEAEQNPYGIDYPPAEAANEEIARQALDLVHAGDFDGLVLLFAPSDGNNAESMAAAFAPVLAATGDYVGYTELPAMQATDEAPEVGEVTGVLIECEYTEAFVLWQVLLNTEGQILGISVAASR